MTRELQLLLILTLSIPGSSGPASSIPVRKQQLDRSATSIADERGMVALDQALRDLTNPFTIASVAACPGDEDSGLLAYYRKKLGARTVNIFATRGEASDLSDQNGLEPTRKAIEAARILGADIYFLNLRDIGVSKSPDEALKAWSGQEAVLQMVRAFRSLRPDVVVVGRPRNLDGQYQAVIQLALEAFTAAADAQRFPELSPAWQVRRVYEPSSDKDGDVSINLEEYDHVRGRTYAQISNAANTRYGSREISTEPARLNYKLSRFSSDEKPTGTGTLFGGLELPSNLSRSVEPLRVPDISLEEALTRRDSLLTVLSEKLAEKRAEGSKEQLQDRYGVESFRVSRFIEALERAIALALGVEFEVDSGDPILTRGQKFSLKLKLRNGANRLLAMAFHVPERVLVPGTPTTYKPTELVTLSPASSVSKDFEYVVPGDAAYTLPHSAHLYDTQYYAAGSAPGGSPLEAVGVRLVAFAEVALDHATILLPAFTLVDVAPPVELSLTPDFAFIRDWNDPRGFAVTINVVNRIDGPLVGALWIVPLALTRDDYKPLLVRLSRQDENATIKLKLELPILKPPLSPDILVEFRRASPAALGALSSVKLVVKPLDLQVSPELKVGYVRGPESSLSTAFTQLGVDSRELSIAEIRSGDLSGFDTIVIDRFAYELHPDLMSQGEALLDYVKGGGNLIVFYQRPGDWSLQAPYPMKTSMDRIAVETAPVRLLDSDHPLLTTPNRISEGDFDNWVQERAVFLAKEWNEKYTPLLESADPGEEPSRGGLLIASSGQGTYIYTAYAWSQQLRAMNGGAHRFLANLLSLPRVIKSQKREGN